MVFWKWYLAQIKDLLKLILSQLELIGGIILVVAGVIAGIYDSLWFLFLVPVGITAIAHSSWRELSK